MSADRHMFPPPSSPSPPGAVEGFGGVDPQSSPLAETETLRMFVTERLAAAVDDILGEFVKTVSRYREQIDRQRRQLDSLRAEEGGTSPQQASGLKHLSVRQADVHQLLPVRKQEFPAEQQQRSPGLHQEEPPEAAVTRIPLPAVAVKVEEDEPAGSFGPERREETSPSSECDTDDSSDWEETREPLQDAGGAAAGGAAASEQQGRLQTLSGVQTSKPFVCSVCGKRYTYQASYASHMRSHSRGRVHAEDEPFSCGVCGKRFAQQATQRQHMAVHTGEKPFSCSVCGEGFAQKDALRLHTTVHGGEKLFSCSVCCKGFASQSSLSEHLRVHREQKRFGCSVCDKTFTRYRSLKTHTCDEKTAETGSAAPKL